ncbi:MAG: hypothetical protein ABI818_00605 [Acidobacteriota bacterium]
MTLKLTGVACVLAASVAGTSFHEPLRASVLMQTAPPQFPDAQISNGLIVAKLYLPDARRGFYRSTRFDWSGVISSLEYEGHHYYGPWFTKSDPPVRDFVYQGADIITGAQSTMMGPAEEFQRPQGYATAKPGGTFVKIGVGVLRKADDTAYSPYTNYEIVDAGKWSVKKDAASVELVQELQDAASGYGYVYRKTVRLTAGRPELVLEHSLQNTGRLPLQTPQYNHNFLSLDGATTSADFVVSAPFQIRPDRQPDPKLAEVRGREIVYTKTLADQERVTFALGGFGADPKDYDFRVENRRTGAGFRVTSDRPLASASLWSIRSVISIEPFVDVSTEPGQTFTWKYIYTYYKNPPK